MIGEKPMTHFAPRAAVIMPAYNAEGTIEKTVRSILGQSMGDLVLIVVDDGDPLAPAGGGRAPAAHQTAERRPRQGAERGP